MATITTKKSEKAEASEQLKVDQRRPAMASYRLQVDRQMKASFTTFEEAEKRGKAIKKITPYRAGNRLRRRQARNKDRVISPNRLKLSTDARAFHFLHWLMQIPLKKRPLLGAAKSCANPLIVTSDGIRDVRGNHDIRIDSRGIHHDRSHNRRSANNGQSDCKRCVPVRLGCRQLLQRPSLRAA